MDRAVGPVAGIWTTKNAKSTNGSALDLLIWGGVSALGGRNTKILVIACGAAIVWAILSAVILSAQLPTYSIRPSDFTSAILPILIIAFCLNAQSRTWVRSRGGATF